MLNMEQDLSSLFLRIDRMRTRHYFWRFNSRRIIDESDEEEDEVTSGETQENEEERMSYIDSLQITQVNETESNEDEDMDSP